MARCLTHPDTTKAQDRRTRPLAWAFAAGVRWPGLAALVACREEVAAPGAVPIVFMDVDLVRAFERAVSAGDVAWPARALIL
jgi:hypothetical protein